MLSKVGCSKCDGKMRLISDAYGAYYICAMCGAQRDTECPHCNTSSILVKPSISGLAISCKVCGCSNKQLVQAVCVAPTISSVPA